jgi:outer membrane protein
VKRIRSLLLLSITAAAALAACAAPSPIGLVDVNRIVANWPEYQSDQSQLVAEERSIESRRESARQKQRDAMALQRKYTQLTDQLSQQIRNAAGTIAAQRQLKLVFTREGIGYGGVDITADVEKALNITEKASPSPGT